MGGTGPGSGGAVVETAELGGTRGNKGNGGFDDDGVGGVGSERECMLVGDSVTRREDTETGVMTGRRGPCGGVGKVVGRGGIGGGSFWECCPCGKCDRCDAIDEAESGLWPKDGGMGGTGSSRVPLRTSWEGSA